MSGSESGFLVRKVVAVLSPTFIFGLASAKFDASRKFCSEMDESVLLSYVMVSIEGTYSGNVTVSSCVCLSP